MDEDIKQLIQMFEDRYGLIVSVARRYAPAPDLVYDIAQQSFVGFIETVRKNGWDMKKDITPLLYGITKNVAIACWREEQRQRTAAMRAFDELVTAPLSPEKVLEETTEQRKKVAAFQDCLRLLTDKDRQWILTHYQESVSMEAIARRENRSANAVRLVFCRIRRKLRDCIKRKTEGRPK